jgi:hypothetical protein
MDDRDDVERLAREMVERFVTARWALSARKPKTQPWYPTLKYGAVSPTRSIGY